MLQALWLLPVGLMAQSTLYNTGQIQRIEIQFSQPNWDYMMDTAKYGADSYIMADWVKVNGTQYLNPGVKYKGNSSYDSTLVKNPLHIELDTYVNQAHEGYTDIKLGNGYADPSMIREVLAYSILSNYMHCPQANFAEVFINGNYLGLYSNVENIAKEFCSDHFYSSTGTFFKCGPVGIPGPTTKSNLKTITGVDSTGYFPRYELKSNFGWNDLVALCDVVTNTPANLGSTMDMDRAIWMLAFNDLLVNLDSYSGVFCQNYYIYRDQTGHYNPVVWDLNMSFGGFPYLGGGATGMGSLTVTDMQNLPVNIHETDPFWPLINDVMANARYRRMYMAHLRTIADEMFGSGTYSTMAAGYQALVDTAVQSDNNKFFTYSQFQNGMTASAQNGSYTVPGISSLMTARLSYLQGVSEFTATQPSIDSVASAPQAPALNATVTISADVATADSVFLGYRLDQSQKFVRVPMYDDGAHGDGGAGDGRYGASFTLSSAEAQYYVYAENANAGRFSPARAEHEFHTVQAALNFPSPGDLVINEFLAINQTGQTDEAGQFEDWIELFNNRNQPLLLTGLYLTDDPLNRTKCALPAGTTIGAQSTLIIWADEDASTPSYVHCNFKLSSQGEDIKLGNNSFALDSLTFGPQTADISIGRCPDGTGAFSAQGSPTFDALNCGVGTPESGQVAEIQVFPNPASDRFTVRCDQVVKGDWSVTNALGVEMGRGRWQGQMELEVKEWPTGIYFVRLGAATHRLAVTH
ncbi:MAG: CotH kinase family protein [Bacteroidia bacterium]